MSTTTIPEKVEAQVDVPERIEQRTCFSPLVDVAESDEAVILEIDLPGVEAQNVEVDVEDGVLTIDARVEPRQKAGVNMIWQEYGIGDYVRAFRVGSEVDTGAITAELTNGELKLTLPKLPSAKTRRIAIATG